MSKDRTVFVLTGADRVSFLQGLVTNNVEKPAREIVYSALLTPQGKYIADFFVVVEPDRLLIDVATSHAAQLAQRLQMYRLRADVQIAESGIVVSCGTSDRPEGGLADPRHRALGWRFYGTDDISDETDWTAVRVANLVPETGIELTPETYILEAGFERLNGIDFKKGCYVGQEIAARMKHKTELKKGLAQLRVDGTVSPGDEITSSGKPAGTVHSVSGDLALAYLRFDRSAGMETKGAKLEMVARAA